MLSPNYDAEIVAVYAELDDDEALTFRRVGRPERLDEPPVERRASFLDAADDEPPEHLACDGCGQEIPDTGCKPCANCGHVSCE